MEQLFDIDKNKELFDSSKLLDFYFTKVKSIQDRINSASSKAAQCNDYIYNLSDNLSPLIDKENKKMNAKTVSLNNQVLQYKEKFAKAVSVTDKEKLASQIDKLEKEYTKDVTEFEKLTNSLDETLKILKPININIENLKKISTHSKQKFLFFRFRKIVVNTATIVFIAFILNYIIDLIQSFTELSLQTSHLNILIVAFLIQTFIIDPYILTKLKSKLNWKFIDSLKVELLSLDNKLETQIQNFNSMVTNWKELNQFKI